MQELDYRRWAMSKYTTEVRFICEQLAGERASMGYMNVNSILQASAPKVFDFDFPLFDEEYRLALECKILRHYYTREISEETVGLWKLRLEDRMNMIMPYYNQLYQSQLLKFNPLYDIDLTTEHTREANSDSESNSESNQTANYSDSHTQSTNSKMNNVTTDDSSSNNDDAFSDTPQGGLDDVKNYKYLTNFRNTKGNTDRNTVSDETNDSKMESATNSNSNSNATGKSVGSVKNLESYIEHVSGKTSSKSYNVLLKEFRENMLNVDNLIINELSDLFFGLWE